MMKICLAFMQTILGACIVTIVLMLAAGCALLAMNIGVVYAAGVVAVLAVGAAVCYIVGRLVTAEPGR